LEDRYPDDEGTRRGKITAAYVKKLNKEMNK